MSRNRHHAAGSVVVGTGLLILGLLFLFDQLDIIRIFDIWDLVLYWPLILIGVGLTRLGSKEPTDLAFMIGMVGLGSWFLLDNLGFIDVSPFEMFWPLVLIVVGGALVLGALRRRGAPTHPDGDGDGDSVNMLTVLSSTRRRVTGNKFRGGEMMAFMGGGELDLTEAGIAGDVAVIRVFVMMGGFKIKLPKSWHLDNKVVPLLGGTEDKTSSPGDESGPRLVLKGWAIMGGLELEN